MTEWAIGWLGSYVGHVILRPDRSMLTWEDGGFVGFSREREAREVVADIKAGRRRLNDEGRLLHGVREAPSHPASTLAHVQRTYAERKIG